MKKRLLIKTMILLILTFSFCHNVYGSELILNHTEPALIMEVTDIDEADMDGIIWRADSFLSMGDSSKISTENMQSMSNTIYSTLLIIGTIVAFIVGAILGIKFITSGLEGKAEVKQMLIPYIVGLVVLFGAFTIWKVVLNILQK